jgi:UPF0755 protein
MSGSRKTRKRVIVTLATGLTLALAASLIYLRLDLRKPYPQAAIPAVLDIPRGLRARDVVKLLKERNLIDNSYATLAYIFYSGVKNKLHAGEYLFDRPMTPTEVIGKIVAGNVYLRKFTVPEGLTIDATAQKWQEQGFGAAGDFLQAAHDSTSLISDLNADAPSLEGYLFPETYSFASRTTERQAIQAMVQRFKTVLAKLREEEPETQWPPEVAETVTLASLVESEAAKTDERPVVASVYLNRLSRRMLLQCDPTGIYALEQADRYSGRITLTDLKFPSPYNTYLRAGLPPGPITNPGYASLRAAVRPASTEFLYFVRTTDGRHTFSEDLTAHNKAVAAYRAIQRSERH